MSANLDLVRSIYSAWERGDFTPGEWAHPEIECVRADGPDPGSWTGLAGLAEAQGGFQSAWEEYRPKVDEYRELDGERVLVLYRRTGRGKKADSSLGRCGRRARAPSTSATAR